MVQQALAVIENELKPKTGNGECPPATPMAG
jgi:hypothetical protein